MSKKAKTAVRKSNGAVQANGKRTPESLRKALQEFDIETSAASQARAIGAIYRVATHEAEVNLRTLLSAIGRHQNLTSLALRHAALTANKKAVDSAFFLTA